MKLFTTLIFSTLLSAMVTIVSAQETHIISVTSNKFTPSTLEINPGDTVTWKNTQGNHNVNGTTSTYPSNPESFGNDVGSGWTFTHVFNTIGTYDYRCNPHFSFGMSGKIIVQGPTSIYTSIKENIQVYPTVFTNNLHINRHNSAHSEIHSVYIFNITGREITNIECGTGLTTVNTELWESGIYFYKIIANNKTLETKKIIKQ